MNDEAKLAHAFRLLQQRNFQEAETLCRSVLRQSPNHAAATHLLGLVRKDWGDLAEGERLMRASIDLEPSNAEFRSNLGNLLRRQGRLQEAEKSYRKALHLDPNHRPSHLGLAQVLNELGKHNEAAVIGRALTKQSPNDPNAWLALGQTFHDQEKWTDAESAFRKAVTISQGNAIAHHNLGSVLSRLERAEEALEHLKKAESLGINGFHLAFNLGRTYLQLYRMEEAGKAFAEAVAINPLDIEAQINLARMRFMQGEEDFARDISAAASAHGDDPRLQMLAGIVLRRAGDFQGAESVLRDLLARQNVQPEAHAALAEVLHEMGRLEEAEQEALAAARAAPRDPSVNETLVSILLARGRANAALPYIRSQRAQQPFEQGWLAYEATAARLLGHDLYPELYDYDRLVRVFELEPPPGWTSIEELNTALIEALNVRHQFPTHPLDQSLRHGSQTARSMLTDPDVAIRAVIKAFQGPLEEYRQAIGTDPDHPISVRNRASATITGAWSVQLRREGFHVNHVHPEGWISSAYYVSVPEEVRDETLKSGWIKFGEPRFPVPGAEAERIVQPRAGLLVLFPSYMWHGTNPIHGGEPRTTIAFDAKPANEVRS
jgi:Flp pilus assembly protein TadD